MVALHLHWGGKKRQINRERRRPRARNVGRCGRSCLPPAFSAAFYRPTGLPTDCRTPDEDASFALTGHLPLDHSRDRPIATEQTMRKAQSKPSASPTCSASGADEDDRLSSTSVGQSRGHGGRGSSGGGGGAPFNPLLALQTLLAGDVVSAKQQTRAAQQLGEHLRALPTAASLHATYERYLVLFAELMVASGKGARELRASVLDMLQALAGHNPRR